MTIFFSRIPLPVFFFATIVLLLAAAELGSWISRRWVRDREHDGPIGTLVSAMLGLLAFMLAFTFGMTTSRFDQRRQLVLEEANSISSAYLASTLNESRPFIEIRKRLGEYLQTRLDITRENLPQRIARSNQLFTEIWSQVRLIMKDPKDTDLRTALIADLTQLDGLQRSRISVGLGHRIPGSMWLSLYVLAFISMLTIGYQVGATGPKRLLGMPALVLAFALVMALIADVDRPEEGQFRVGAQPFWDVHEKIQSLPK